MNNNNYLTAERDEWLASKKGKMTASDCFRLFNPGTRPMTQVELDARPLGPRGGLLDKRTTVETMFGDGALSYIREKIDELISANISGDDTDSMTSGEYKQTDWGNSYEWDGLRQFELVTGKKIIYYGGGTPKFFSYGYYSGCSPDGEVIGESALIEAKCPYDTDVHTRRLLYETVEEFKEKEWKEYCQVQAQMKIMGRDFCYYVSFDPRKIYKAQQMKIIKIKADHAWQEEFDKRLEAAILVMRDMLLKTEMFLSIE